MCVILWYVPVCVCFYACDSSVLVRVRLLAVRVVCVRRVCYFVFFVCALLCVCVCVVVYVLFHRVCVRTCFAVCVGGVACMAVFASRPLLCVIAWAPVICVYVFVVSAWCAWYLICCAC